MYLYKYVGEWVQNSVHYLGRRSENALFFLARALALLTACLSLWLFSWPRPSHLASGTRKTVNETAELSLSHSLALSLCTNDINVTAAHLLAISYTRLLWKRKRKKERNFLLAADAAGKVGEERRGMRRKEREHMFRPTSGFLILYEIH